MNNDTLHETNDGSLVLQYCTLQAQLKFDRVYWCFKNKSYVSHRPSKNRLYSNLLRGLCCRRSLERGQQIQEKLHNLVHAFHERARQVKEQVVVQPPSPTLSPSEDSKPFPKLSIPLHQMPIQQQTPPRGSSSEIPGEDRMIHLWGYDIEVLYSTC